MDILIELCKALLNLLSIPFVRLFLKMGMKPARAKLLADIVGPASPFFVLAIIISFVK